MSIYYSKFTLNTWSGTPYFQAQLPANYPVDLVLQKVHSFRNLPPNLQELSRLSKAWAARHFPAFHAPGIEQWYDAEGYEIDPDSGRKLTDAEIDAQWGGQPADTNVTDIPIPAGRFPDPSSWEETKHRPAAVVAWGRTWDEGINVPTELQLLNDMTSHGLEATAKEYGIDAEQLHELLTN